MLEFRWALAQIRIPEIPKKNLKWPFMCAKREMGTL
jgi:hypothetical protein